MRRKRRQCSSQDDLEKLGINVIFQPIEFNTLIDKIDNTYDYECAFSAFGSAVSPTRLAA